MAGTRPQELAYDMIHMGRDLVIMKVKEAGFEQEVVVQTSSRIEY